MIPGMRASAVKSRKKKRERPLLPDERIAEIEMMLREAAYGKKSITVTYHDGEKLVKITAERIVFLQHEMVGLDETVIHYSQITDARF